MRRYGILETIVVLPSLGHQELLELYLDQFQVDLLGMLHFPTHS